MTHATHSRRGKGGAAIVAVAAMVIATLGAGAPPAAAATSSLSVVQSTSSTGFDGAGSTIDLGFLVTNTGTTTLSNVAVTDTVGAANVGVTCAQTVLLPGAQTTCNATYATTGADVNAGSVTSAAVARATNAQSVQVQSSASAVTVPYARRATTPFRASRLSFEEPTCRPAAYNWAASCDAPSYLPFMTGQYRPTNPYADWKVTGSTSTDATGSTTCTTRSVPPTTGPIPGTFCLGGAGPETTFSGAAGTTIGAVTGNGAGGTLSVASTAGFPSSGRLVVTVTDPGNGPVPNPTFPRSGASWGAFTTYVTLAYTSTTATSFQGVTMVPGGALVWPEIPVYNGSNGSPSLWTLAGGAAVSAQVAGGRLPVKRIMVPSSNVVIPVSCAWSFHYQVNFGFYHNTYGTPCTFQAQVSTNGVDWRNLAAPVTITNPVSSPAPGQTCTPFDHWGVNGGNNNGGAQYGDWTCWSPPVDLVVALPAALQYVRIRSQSPAHRGIGGTSTFEGHPIQVNVQPGAAIQANVLVNRIVYQPPGADSSQRFTVDSGTSAMTEVSFGQSDASIREVSNTLGFDVSLSSSYLFWNVNLTTSNSWTNNTRSVQTTASESGRGMTVSTTIGTTLTTPPWPNGSNPSSPPWMNDVFNLLVNPEFALWNFSACTNGASPPTYAPATVVGNTTTCPNGFSVEESTGIAPRSVFGSQQVTVAQLVGQPGNSCLNGTAELTLVSGGVLDQEQCRSILAQDPFAAAGLGLRPTPAGQSPGSAVNPATMLDNPDAVALQPISQGPTASGTTLTRTDEQVVTNSYSATSSMETEVTAARTNSISASAGGGIGPLFNATATFNWSMTDVSGSSLIQNYTGSESFTQSQAFTAEAVIADADNAVTTTPFLDPRFSTFMFQSGSNGTNASPHVTGVTRANVTLNRALGAGQVLRTGAKLTVLPLPFPLLSGQKLKLPGGQTLVTTAAVPVNATKIPVKPATVRTAVAVGAAVRAVGTAAITASGHSFGPVNVRFCENATTEPSCKRGVNVTTPYLSPVMYATTTKPTGTRLSVVVTNQAGRTTGTGTAFTV